MQRPSLLRRVRINTGHMGIIEWCDGALTPTIPQFNAQMRISKKMINNKSENQASQHGYVTDQGRGIEHHPHRAMQHWLIAGGVETGCGGGRA